MKNQKKHRVSSPAIFESLENRQFLSASPTVKPDAAVVTTTSLFVSNRSALLGQTVTIKGVVASSGGIDKGATAELLEGNTDTGLIGTINHLGYVVFTLDAGQAAYVGTHLWRIRVLTDGNFVGSKSRQLIAKTLAPSLVTESNGLELGTVVAGTGTTTAQSGSTVVVQYTGFDAANGSVFDDSANHSPGTFTFTIDDTANPVITGFDDEATGMKVGQVNVAVIPSALGYNDGETRVFVLKVLSIS